MRTSEYCPRTQRVAGARRENYPRVVYVPCAETAGLRAFDVIKRVWWLVLGGRVLLQLRNEQFVCLWHIRSTPLSVCAG